MSLHPCIVNSSGTIVRYQDLHCWLLTHMGVGISRGLFFFAARSSFLRNMLKLDARYAPYIIHEQ